MTFTNCIRGGMTPAAETFHIQPCTVSETFTLTRSKGPNISVVTWTFEMLKTSARCCIFYLFIF